MGAALQGIALLPDTNKADIAAKLLAHCQCGDLLIVGRTLDQAHRRQLLQGASRRGGPAILLGPAKGKPRGRAVLLNHGNESFLTKATALCRSLDLAPLVLTVSRSEPTAATLQNIACKVLDNLGISADYDLIVGWETRAALASVARWRGCQLAIVEQQDDRRWWQRLTRSASDWRADLAESLPLLILPGKPGERLTGERHSFKKTVGGWVQECSGVIQPTGLPLMQSMEGKS